ncbi:MAG: hypothetical protein L6R36_004240 [Xanthoria steineri]|nr:MAG: hypothetical protein L6R36_004240 [Xanthoria steineri]
MNTGLREDPQISAGQITGEGPRHQSAVTQQDISSSVWAVGACLRCRGFLLPLNPFGDVWSEDQAVYKIVGKVSARTMVIRRGGGRAGRRLKEPISRERSIEGVMGRVVQGLRSRATTRIGPAAALALDLLLPLMLVAPRVLILLSPPGVVSWLCWMGPERQAVYSAAEKDVKDIIARIARGPLPVSLKFE